MALKRHKKVPVLPQADGPQPNRAEQKKKQRKKILYLVIMLVAVAVFLYSAVQLILIFIQDKQTDDLYNSLYSDVIPSSSEQESDPMDAVFDFDRLSEINTEIKGWLVVPECNVNYPVLLGPTNDAYLRTAYDKTYSFAGSLFLDYRNTGEFDSRHPIIYGHNQENHKMFSDLVKYRDTAFAEENRYFYLYTKDYTYKYEIFSTYVVDAYADTYQLDFADDAAFNTWLAKITGLSSVDYGVNVSASDKILTLSTCVFDYDTARLVVHGKVVETKPVQQ